MNNVEKSALRFENREILEDILSTESVVFKKINTVAVAYTQLTGEPFTDSTFKDIVANGVANIKDRYHKEVSAFVNKLEAPFPGLTNHLIDSNSSNQSLQLFEASVRDLLENRYISRLNGTDTPHVPLEYIEIVNGEPRLTEDHEKGILKLHCTITLETEEEIATYEHFIEFSNAYNKFVNSLSHIKKMIPEYGVSGTRGTLPVWQLFKIEENKSIGVDPASIKRFISYTKSLHTS